MTCRLSRPIGGCGDTSGDFPLASALRLDRGKGVYRPVTKRAMMMMVKICIVPCMPTTKWKSRSCLRRRAEGAYRSYRISKLGKGYGFLWQSCLPRSSEGPWRWRCARCSDYRGLGVVTLPSRRFPHRGLSKNPCSIVRDANGQALAYVYFEDQTGRRQRPNTPLRISVFFDTCRGRGPSLTPRPPIQC